MPWKQRGWHVCMLTGMSCCERKARMLASLGSTLLLGVHNLAFSRHMQAMATADPGARWLMQAWLFYDNQDFWRPPQIKVRPA